MIYYDVIELAWLDVVIGFFFLFFSVFFFFWGGGGVCFSGLCLPVCRVVQGAKIIPQLLLLLSVFFCFFFLKLGKSVFQLLVFMNIFKLVHVPILNE